MTTDAGTPTRGVVRVLVPVVLNLLALAFMIHSGLDRNRERVRASRDQLDGVIRMVGATCDLAAQYLESAQGPDGSWPNYRSPHESLQPAAPAANVASTMRILLNLKGTPYESERFFEAGLTFVRNQRPQHEPTVEKLSLGWLLLRDEWLSVPELRALLERGQTPEGLYRHELTGAGDGPAHLGENVLLLGVLPAMGHDASRLEAAIRGHLDRAGPIPPRWWLRSAHRATLAAATAGVEAEPRLRGLVGDWDQTGRFPTEETLGPQESLDNVSLAAYLKVRSDTCLAHADPCNNVNASLRTLLRRQEQGRWAAGPFGGFELEIPRATGERGFTGSDPETTSMVINALTTFGRVLDARSKGTVRRRPPVTRPHPGAGS